MNLRSGIRIVLLGPCAGLIAAGLAATTPCSAASIPAWLDESISKWNTENPALSIRFVDIKDSFAWYDVPKTPELQQKQIRESVGRIALGNNYVPLDDEAVVTTGKPPVVSGRSQPKKCWSQSYVMNIQSQNNTKAVGEESPGQRQRMLTSLVCEDTSHWWAAFRVAD